MIRRNIIIALFTIVLLSLVSVSLVSALSPSNGNTALQQQGETPCDDESCMGLPPVATATAVLQQEEVPCDDESCLGLPPVADTTTETKTESSTSNSAVSPQADPAWLTHMNNRRALANLPPATNNSSWSDGCEKHSKYMVKNDVIGHSEEEGNAWYTAEGDLAASKGNVAVNGNMNATDESFIDMWIEGPFHALGILDPRLEQSSYGSYREDIGTWKAAATLDVIRGLGSVPDSVTFPVMFPAEGKVMPITSFRGRETPDPLTSCSGYEAPTGPPIMIQLEQTPSVSSVVFSKDGQSLDACNFDETSYTNSNASYQSLGRSVLNMRHAVVVMPREPLTDGTYTVSVTSNDQTHSWSFCVGTCEGIENPTATPEATATPPEATATAMATPTPTEEPTATPSPTPPVESDPDSYESDNTCLEAGELAMRSKPQQHTFHNNGDADWVKINVEQDAHYVVEGRVPQGSQADLGMDMYLGCDTIYDSSYTNYTATLGIRLHFSSPISGEMFLKFYNEQADMFGSDIFYNLSIRKLPPNNNGNGVIIAADGGTQHPKVSRVANHISTTFKRWGKYQDDHIYRLYPPYTSVYSVPVRLKLQDLITGWAKDNIGTDGTLNLFFIGKGVNGGIYLNSDSDEQITAADLHTWLDTLEQDRPDIKINVVIDASFGGSFIPALKKAGANRVVIASTGANQTAWSSMRGSLFSDYFLIGLARGASLYDAYSDASLVIQIVKPWTKPASGMLQAADSEQSPMLDDNGDGVSDSNDGDVARQSGIATSEEIPSVQTNPVISDVTLSPVDNGVGTIQATIQGDQLTVWAEVYPPSYEPPESQGDLLDATNVTTATLTLQQGTMYETSFTYSSTGSYRVIVYAEDENGIQAQPATNTINVVQANPRVYLPMVLR